MQETTTWGVLRTFNAEVLSDVLTKSGTQVFTLPHLGNFEIVSQKDLEELRNLKHENDRMKLKLNIIGQTATL